MDREAVLSLLAEKQQELKDCGVKSLHLFGSVARGDQTEGSDLDLLVEFSRPEGLFDFLRLKHFLEQITNHRVDLVTLDALRPEMKEQIIKEAVALGSNSE